MFLADMHTHSECSNDGSYPMRDMLAAADRAGIDALCITDHCDIEKYDTGLFDPDCFDWERVLLEYENALSTDSHVNLLLGIELSSAARYPEFARGVTGGLPLDFIIGSVHNLKGCVDFYCLKYETEEQCFALLERYVDEHFELLRLCDFDVFGHIGYPLRYMKAQGFDVSLSPFGERLSALFKELADTGRGIEINTSGLRGSPGCTMPELSLLRMFRECGGEIVTIGSDAHEPEHVGCGVRDAQALLLDAGFRYQCVFKNRKAEFIKL